MTKSDYKKTAKRFYYLIINGFRSAFNPLVSILFSYLIVTYFSKELWGDFVNYLLFFFIATLVTNWGNKTYLLRAFSQNPKYIVRDWQQMLIVRLSLCLIFVLIIFCAFSLHLTLYLCIWLLSAFFYNSFTAIIFYNRDYLKSLSIEAIGLLILLAQLYFSINHLDLDLLIRFYALSLLAKAVLSVIYFHSYLDFKKIIFNFNLLKLSFPFFILGISGFLQSKIDIYAFSFFHQGKLLAEYQIISGFFIFSQSIVMLLIFPYIKNIYRIPLKSLNKLKRNISLYGLIFNAIIVLMIDFILLLFDIELSFIELIFGFIIGYPCYIYTFDILIYFKSNKEKIVIKVSALSMMINFVLSIVLLNSGFQIQGVLAANAIGQICAVSYYLWLRKSQNQVQTIRQVN